jgi:hypothetical protein
VAASESDRGPSYGAWSAKSESGHSLICGHSLIYCADYKCSHSIQMSADRWPDHVRLSHVEPLFVCQACGKRGADVRGLFAPARMGTG